MAASARSVVTPARLAAAAPAERLALLRSSPAGLGADEIARRRRAHGPNEPVRAETWRPWLAFASNFTHTLALLLWFAAGLAFAGGMPELGGAIVAVVALNGIFAFLQSYRAEKVVAALLRRVSVHARVVREGAELHVPAGDLVPGDVIRVAAGDIVPADVVLLDADQLTLDISMITGESAPVERTAAPDADATETTPVVEIASLLPAGAAVITGTGRGVVHATGPESTLGRIAAMVEGVHRGDSILEQQISALSRVTAVIAVIAGALTLVAVSLVTRTTFVAALVFGTGVIVALVPEGLLPTLSVSLAVGARRMAKRGAAVRRLSAVEIVGSVTVICTDKTGTLTENAVSVLGFVAAKGRADEDAARLAAALCNDARAADGAFEGDPLEVALADWATEGGVEYDEIRRRHPRLSDVPFDAHRRSMSVTCDVDGARRRFVKGAPEAVIALAGLAAPPPALAEALAEATARGERVLMLAEGEDDEPPRILGIVRLHDPPRPEVPAALAACRRAGVRVVMLTGDHPATAGSVARAVGLGEVPVIAGEALSSMSDAALAKRLRGDAVFARIEPAGKLRIVELLRKNGEVVVVTGDGINDAPALRAADVGVAMGLRGTEVAKQSADIILGDDNFATIVAAIEEGRSIRANIRRFVGYVFTSNVAELAPFLLFVLLPIPLPLAIVQVLAIDLGTDLLPALALGVEPPTPGLMEGPAEPPRSPVLTRKLFLEVFLFWGPLEATLGLAGYLGYFATLGWRPFAPLSGYSPDAVRAASTLTFLGIVAGQIGCLAASRDGPLRARLSLRGVNPWIGAGLAFEIALALVLVYVPGLNRLFAMAPIHPAWLAVLPAGALVFIALDQVRRLAARALGRRAPAAPPTRRRFRLGSRRAPACRRAGARSSRGRPPSSRAGDP